MQFSVPRVDKQQEQSLAWAQIANLSWASKEAGPRELTSSEASSLKEATGQDAKRLTPGVVVVDLSESPDAKLWAAEAFTEALKSETFAPGSWAWDAKSASWRALSSERVEHTHLFSKNGPKIEEIGVEPAGVPVSQKTIETSETESLPLTNPTVYEINIFKDDKQHILYSLKHVCFIAKIFTTIFSQFI